MAGWLADEMRVNFKFLKFIVDRILNFLLRLTFIYNIIRAI